MNVMVDPTIHAFLPLSFLDPNGKPFIFICANGYILHFSSSYPYTLYGKQQQPAPFIF